ncbi:MAG: hypothetical protein Q4B04_04275, partial [bacterium]|nr:hypothetical protein [bacterium]
SSFVSQRESVMKDIFVKKMICIDFENFIGREPIEIANYTDIFKLFTGKLIGKDDVEQKPVKSEKKNSDEPAEKKKKKKEKEKEKA